MTLIHDEKPDPSLNAAGKPAVSRVLLVEDNPAAAELQRYILDESGFEVRIARGVRDAVEQLERETFHALILDYRLPDGSAWTVVDSAKSRSPEVPVVIVTSLSAENIVIEAMHRGVSEYAVKEHPYWSQLPTTVERIISLARAKQRLQSESALFETVVGNSSDVIGVLSLDSTIRYVSAASRKLFGYAPEDLFGRQHLDFVHPEDQAILAGFFATLGQTGRAVAEYRHLTSGGGNVWIESSGNALRDSGQGAEVVIVARDISNRKKVEQALREREAQLRESEERYRGLVESVHDYSILMLDPGGHIATWTVAAQRIEGYSSEEILGKHFECLYTPEDIARGRPSEILRIAALQGKLNEEGVQVRKDGSRFWTSVGITAIRDEDGELRGFSKITRDITERVESEAKIRRSEALFRALLEATPDAVVLTGHDGRIHFVNAQAERMFLYPRSEMEGQPIELLMPAELRSRHEAHREGWEKAPMARKMETGFELKARRKNGQEFPVEVSLNPIQTAQGSWVAAVIRDLTERKRVEQQLVIARWHAEEANQAKSNFLASVSHEIRTPMNAILGMSDLLSETNLTDEQKGYVEIFRRAGAHLMTLIDNILDLSKIEAGQLELEQTSFNLCDPVEQAVELVAEKARIKGIELQARMPGRNCTVTGDPHRLRQVLVNLLGNAVKFTASGTIIVTVEQDSSRQFHFEVADTGIGIPADKLDSIFEDFRQGDASITRKYGGTGLGLGISRRIIEHMGGHLTVSSRVGKGSAFRFILSLPEAAGAAPGERTPDSRAASIADIAEAAAHRAPQALKILIAEDSADNQLLMRLYLKNSPYALTFVEDGKNAVNAVKEGSYDLILMDLQMPEMDGLTATRRIRELEREIGKRPTPILALTANARPQDVKASLEAGCNAHLSKPISKSRISAAVEQYATAGPPPGEDSDDAQDPAIAALVPQYLEARQRDLQTLSTLLSGQNFPAIRRIAHNFKGTGSAYGFSKLTALGAAMETSADAADAETLDRQLRELAQILELGSR